MPAAYHEAPPDSWHVLSLYGVLQAVLLKRKYHANKNMEILVELYFHMLRFSQYFLMNNKQGILHFIPSREHKNN